jgi:hypothetical protein
MGDFAPEVKRILRSTVAISCVQGKGDHEMWKSPISGKSLPVDYKITSRHTANGIMKQAGLPKAFN